MLESSAPTCEAWISPDLLGLLRGSATRAPKPPVTPPAPEWTQERDAPAEPQISQAEQSQPDMGHPPRPAPWPEVVLRVDGDRPARFHGLLLFEHEWISEPEHNGTQAQFVQGLRLFLTQDQGIIAHATCRSVQDHLLRPLFRVRAVAHVADIVQLLEDTRPVCLFDGPAVFAPPGHPLPDDMILRAPGLMLP